MQEPKLFMLMLGCRPAGRNTEQHDIFFGIANSVKELIPDLKDFWPEAKDKLHVDAWREVTNVNGHAIKVELKEHSSEVNTEDNALKLFFLNLGGYKPGEFDEFHYKLLAVAPDQAAAIKEAKQTSFYKHTGFTGASSHIDDKFGVDVDDLYQVKDILPEETKLKYTITISSATDETLPDDSMQLGYFQLHKL